MTESLRNRGQSYNFNWSSANMTSDAIQVRSTLFGTLYVPTAFTSTSLTFQASTTLTGTFYGVYDPSDDTQVTMDVRSGRAYQIPAAVMTNHFLKCIGDKDQLSEQTLPFVTKL